MQTIRERILSVYRGETPDVVPYMLDLSHWFYEKEGKPWDLSKAYLEPERDLISYHRNHGVGFYMPNLASFYTTTCRSNVRATILESERDGGKEITWVYETPLGRIARKRVWSQQTYSWHISEWGVRTEQDLRVLGYALSGMTYAAHWDRYRAWVKEVGDCGVVYLPAGYSAMGHLLHYWMGVEPTILATYEWPKTMKEVVDRINNNLLDLIDLLAESPAEIIIMGDNFSGDIQPPSFFEKWSRTYYEEAIRRLHAKGKYVAVHIDGRLRGAIRMIRETGADCGDAITPKPTGDLTLEECREEAGRYFILSGGIPPVLWLPSVSDGEFESAVRGLLDLRRNSPRSIAGAGDQVPPGAVEDRIKRMRDLVDNDGG
jgi:hypothetical protein